MSGKNYFLLTALPTLGPLGSPPPLGRSALVQLAADDAQAAKLVATILLADDLMQRDSVLAGEVKETSPAVLSEAQLRDQEPLPEYLGAPRDAAAGPAIVDRVWENYFRHAAAVADELNSKLLAGYVRFEVALRNALADARAKALSLEAGPYMVAVELADPSADFSQLLSDWASAPHPLAALRLIDRARWQWLADNEPYFSFEDDELAAYAVRLMLLNRWHRLEALEVPDPVDQSAPPTLDGEATK